MAKSEKPTPTNLQEKVNFYLTVVVIVLFAVVPTVLCGLLYLSRVPDITWGDPSSLTYTRIWMHRDRRPVGVAYQTQRVVREFSDTEVCAETRLRFFLWGESRQARSSTSARQMTLIDNRWHVTDKEC